MIFRLGERLEAGKPLQRGGVRSIAPVTEFLHCPTHPIVVDELAPSDPRGDRDDRIAERLQGLVHHRGVVVQNLARQSSS